MVRVLVLLAALFGAPVLAILLTVHSAIAQDGYRIKPGDTLRIEVLEDATINRSALVLPDGSISIPGAGTIGVGGRTVPEVVAELSSRLAKDFAAPPSVFVGVETLAVPRVSTSTQTVARTISIYIIGESANPGKYEVEPGSTLLQVLAESGGFSDFAATKRLQVRRGGTVFTFNYQLLERSVASANPIRLADGDVIIVPQRRLFE